MGYEAVDEYLRRGDGNGTQRTIGYWMERVSKTAESKGWHESDVNVCEALLLIHAEISEAVEEYRITPTNDLTKIDRDGNGRITGYASELADAAIRIFHLCHRMGIDLEGVMEAKDAYNQTRPHRHGGKKI